MASDHGSSKKKNNLIIIQSYPANQTLSKGVIKYFQSYFNVYFINLPGFHPSVAPLNTISIEAYATYVQKYIDKLNLGSFIIAGISFGFLVVKNLNLRGTKCEGVIGLAPYLGRDYLKFSKLKRIYLSSLLKLVDMSGLAPKVWGTKTSKKITERLLGKKSGPFVEIVNNEIDPDTLVKTGLLLLRHKDKTEFDSNLPHVLFMNPKDRVVDFYKTLLSFFDQLDKDRFRVIVTNIEHYPKNPTYKYFKSAITKNELESLFSFTDYSRNHEIGINL